MIALLAVLACAAAVLPMASVKADEGIHAGKLAQQAMVECGFSLKEFAYLCRYRDASTLCRAFQGQAPLDLWQLRWAPLSWWFAFLLKWTAELMRQRLDEAVGTLRMAKADLPQRDDERKRA